MKSDSEHASTATMLIAFSGIDGAGKSTQIELLANYWTGKGYQPITVWTRGGYTTGINLVKQVLRRLFAARLPAPGHSQEREQMFKSSWVQRFWLTIAILDLIRIYAVQLRWWIYTKKIVLCDRYLWDTQIDFELMFPYIDVSKWLLWKILVAVTPKPQVSFLFVIPFEESVRRCAIKYEPFPDSAAIKKQRYSKYLRLAKQPHLQVVDGSQPLSQVVAIVMSKLEV